MSSTAEFTNLQDRVASFEPCNIRFKYDKRQAVLILSIAGFHLVSNAASHEKAQAQCHICKNTIIKMADMISGALALICGIHKKDCLFYQEFTVPPAIGLAPDVRVAQSSRFK